MENEINFSNEETAVRDQAENASEPDAMPAKKGKKEQVLEYVRRVLLLCVGLVIMSFGVALSIRASLGTSPISSVPTVLYYITGLSVGTTTIIVNTAIVLLQIVLLRKRFRLFNLLQIPVCVLFGLLCDFALFCIDDLAPTLYWEQWLICIGGILLVALGVGFEVAANVVTLAGEGLALALCELFPKVKFGYMKIVCDSSLVVISVILSLFFLRELQGVREGTVAAAVFVGLIAKQLSKLTVPLAGLIVYGKKKEPPADAQSDGDRK